MTRPRPSRRSPLLACGLLLVLVVVPCVLTWRAWRQEWRDRKLVRAVQSRNLQSVTVLLQQGANPNARVGKNTPLSWWKMLRDIGIRHKPEEGDTVLLELFDTDTDMVDWEEIVAALLKSGADVDTVDCFRRTPLMYAVEEGRPGSERRLLEAHANVDVQDVDGDTALMRACLREQSLVRPSTQELEILLQYHPDLNKKNSSGQTALSLAKQTALSLAKWAHAAETVRLLKAAGATE